MALSQLLYTSDATVPVDLNELLLIQEVAIRNNARRNITGLLFHCQGRFVQFLEGEYLAVQELYEIIVQDSRHTNVKLLYHRPAKKRLLGDWHLSMLDLDLHTDVERKNLNDMLQLVGHPIAHENMEPADLGIIRKFSEFLEG